MKTLIIHPDDRSTDFLRAIYSSLSEYTLITMAVTVPTPPLLTLYPIWITGCAMYAWASWTRKSFGMLANYILLTTIDSVGLIRMLM